MAMQCAGDAFQPVQQSEACAGDCVGWTSQRDWSQVVNFRILEADGADCVHYDLWLWRNVYDGGAV